jgi:hypothetical protein
MAKNSVYHNSWPVPEAHQCELRASIYILADNDEHCETSSIEAFDIFCRYFCKLLRKQAMEPRATKNILINYFVYFQRDVIV